MSSHCPRAINALLLALGTACAAAAPLAVCVDPDNLPYSRRDGQGFEIEIARIVAAELQRPLELHWQPQRRGFVRKSFADAGCSVLVGVPLGLPGVLTTQPYYRSIYAVVTRADDAAPIASWNDERLPALRIGVQLVGAELAATPPGHWLATHGAVRNVRGFAIDGDGPAPQRMLAALAEHQLDAAVLWGPQAGWYAAAAAVPLRVQMLQGAPQPVDFDFDVAIGVKPGDPALRDAIERALQARRADIDAVLARHHVPRSDPP